MFAKACRFSFVRGMKLVLCIFASCAITLALSSCGNSGSGGDQIAGTGPFDRNGNYVEEWADNPAKWRRPGSSPSPHERRSDELPEIAANEQPPADSVPVVIMPQRSAGNSSSAKPQPVVAQVKPKPKPVLVKAKPKPKPKPKSVRYIVKKGDTLSAIASRNGSSVSAIQRASGVSGSLIRPGQALTIPKR